MCMNPFSKVALLCLLFVTGFTIISRSQTTEIPEAIRLAREPKPELPSVYCSQPLTGLSSGNVLDVFCSGCVTGNYFLAFQLVYTPGPSNTTINWKADLSVSLLDNTTVTWTKPLAVENDPALGLQTFIASIFHDVPLGCTSNRKLRIESKTLTGTVPQGDIKLNIIYYKENLGTFNGSTALGSPTCTPSSNGEIMLSWTNSNPGVVAYDLEWVFISDHDNFSGTATQAFAFREPSRVTVNNQSYKHQIAYPNGRVWYRVRAVGYNPQFPEHRINGNWNFFSGIPLVTANPAGTLNWQQQTIYAEEGKYKKVMNYYDASLRQRQVITNLSTENISLAGETAYDYEGRKAVDIMPVPVSTPITWQNPVNVSISGNTVTKTAGGSSWNAGASSVQQLAPGQNGWIEVRVNATTTQRMFGFSAADINANYTSINYAFYLNNSTLNIYESGTQRSFSASLVVGDILSIHRIGTTVYYKRNGQVVYTSNVVSSTALIADMSIYTVGGIISGGGISVPTLRYIPTLNPFLSQHATVTANTNANRKKFHYDNSKLENSTLDKTSGAGKYYSTVSPFPSVLNDYIPDAEGYAYSQAEYLRDGTGRVSRQSGVGKEFRMDRTDTQNQHTIRNFYGTAAPAEIIRLFGSNVGNANHYKKNLTVDANGQSNVTYLDQEDRVIATALAGTPPANVTALAGSGSVAMTVNLNGRNSIQENKSTTVQKFLKTDNANVAYTFTYNLSAVGAELEELGCQTCSYDLKITLTDPEGTIVQLPAIAGNQDPSNKSYSRTNLTTPANCVTPSSLQAISISPVPLSAPGDYTFVKTLTAREKTFEEVKTIIELNTSVQTVINEIRQSYTVDPAECEICESCPEGEAAIENAILAISEQDCENIKRIIIQELLEANGVEPTQQQIEAYADYCHYTLCNKNKSSEVFERTIARTNRWTTAISLGYNNLMPKDPFFYNLPGYDQNLSGANTAARNTMTTKLNNVFLATINGNTYSGPILNVIDPTNTTYFVDDNGNHNPTQGTHILYVDLMKKLAANQINLAKYNDEIDKQRWTFYKSFYLEAKRKTKLTLTEYQNCTSARKALELVDAMPNNQAGISAWGEVIIGKDTIEIGAPVGKPQIESTLWLIRSTCNIAIIPTDSAAIAGHLQTYFNNNPSNFLRLILTHDVGTNPSLIAIQTILNNYSCNLTSIAQVDPLTCVRDTTIFYKKTVLDPGCENCLTQQQGGGNELMQMSVVDEYDENDPSSAAFNSLVENMMAELMDELSLSLHQEEDMMMMTMMSGGGPTQAEWDALLAFYNSTGGPNWTNKTGWSTLAPGTPQSVSGWYGIQVDANGHVRSISLSNNNLTGTLPNQIGDLQYLQVLQLTFNNLTGSIPSTISQLQNLTALWLDNNALSGSIPSTIGQMTNLVQLLLGNNQFTGSIPSSIGQLQNLVSLYIHQTGVSGTIPAEIGNLVNLKSLLIFSNPQLTGAIPASIGQLTKLETAWLYGNKLSGTIPSSIGNLTNLQVLLLSFNQFLSGSIPSELGQLSKLKVLALHVNQLSGPIPSQLGNLQNLEQLFLFNNQLTGTIPASLSNLSKLNYVYISNNFLRGSISPIGNLPLVYLDISTNNFTFADFLPVKQALPPSTTFLYAGQRFIDNPKTIYFFPGETLSLTTTIDRATSPLSTYRWYKAGVALAPSFTETGHTYTKSNFQAADASLAYYYEIQNPNAPGLTLRSQYVNVQLAPVDTSYNRLVLCLEYDSTNVTLSNWKFSVNWNEVVQQCLANAAKEDSILIDFAISRVIDSVATQFYTSQSTNCMANATEALSYTYTTGEHHYTLYYYDQAGNLVQTVPPEGVDLINQNHTRITRYRFNSLNQSTWQNTPDAGTSQFWYNQKGQLRLSQNAQQAIDGKYSYTRYDNQGRIVEVGELYSTAQPETFTALLEDTSFPDALTYTLKDVTKTFYDFPHPNLPQFPQQFLRNRVAWVEVHEKDAPSVVATYYSYDIHGNVKSLLQQIPGMGQKRTDYVYDLVSGKVNYVLYQYGEPDQFMHKYSYDADNRITRVETSVDGYLWDREAEYYYYLHGPLARVWLGPHTGVQGLDYYYTLQGWIKGVNMPYASDLSNDGYGTSKTGRDVFAYTLGYYNGDFKPRNPNKVLADTRDQVWTRHNSLLVNSGYYNGNIAWMVTDLKKVGQEQGLRRKGMQARSFLYDQLHRIVKSRAFSDYIPGTGFNGRAEVPFAYDEDFSYDANGNLLTLKRRDNLNALSDDYIYEYYHKTNKLRFINPITENKEYTGIITSDNKLYNNITVRATANVANGDDVTIKAYNNIDIEEGFDLNDNANFRAYIIGDDEGQFNYDAIGNLVWDQEKGVRIAWTPYGKVRSVTKGDGSKLEFRYDGAGNRIEKKMTVNGESTFTRYVRDASGNVMAVYKQESSSGLQWVNAVNVTLSETTITKTGGTSAWDAGVSSSNFIATGMNGWIQTVVGSSPASDINASRMLGFSAIDNGVNYTTIGYGIQLASGGGLAVYESGLFKGWFGTYTTGDVLRIERVGTTIYYKKNGTVFYTSLVPSQTNLVADFSFSHPGGRLLDITASFDLGGLAEQPIYGSSRLGQYRGGRAHAKQTLGLKHYELTNHLGNVLSVVTDNINISPDSAFAKIVAATDYYAFGSEMSGRTYSGGGEEGAYRYGFNGKEKDTENTWGDTSYDYGFRIYNPRYGKFLSVDPLTQSYPMLTPYQFASNRPIDGIDLDGLEYYTYHILIQDGRPHIFKVDDHTLMSENSAGTLHGVNDFYSIYSKSFGEKGRGVEFKYYEYYTGKLTGKRRLSVTSIIFDKESQKLSDQIKHGIYYGPGSPTVYGPLFEEDGQPTTVNPYNFNIPPIDEVDALARKHDMDYDYPGYKPGGYLNDPKTVPMDIEFVKGLQEYLNRAKQTGYIDKYSGRPPSTEAIEAARNAIHAFITMALKKEIQSMLNEFNDIIFPKPSESNKNEP